MRNRLFGAGFFIAACGLLMLPGCAVEGILPKTELPPAPAVQQPYPNFAPDGSDDDRGVLTPTERQDMENRLTKLARDRESGVTKRINQSK